MKLYGRTRSQRPRVCSFVTRWRCKASVILRTFYLWCQLLRGLGTTLIACGKNVEENTIPLSARNRSLLASLL